MTLEAEAAGEAFDKVLILSTSAKAQIGAAYLEAARALDGDKDRRDGAIPAIERYLEKATTYEPASGKDVVAWASSEAERATAAERTTAPIGLLKVAGSLDPGSRVSIGSFALRTAKAYLEKGFLPEAIDWALLAGDTSPDVRKDAASVIRGASVLLKLPEQSALEAKALGRAVQWDPGLEKDDDVFWLRRVALESGSVEGARAYLATFPGGKHSAQASRAVAEAEAVLLEEPFRSQDGFDRSWFVTEPVFRASEGPLVQTKAPPGQSFRTFFSKGAEWRNYEFSFEVWSDGWYHCCSAIEALFRAKDPNNYFLVALHSDGNVYLHEVRNGESRAALAQAPVGGSEIRQRARFRVRVSGSHVDVFRNDEALLASDGITIPAGSVGFRSIHTPGLFRDVSVRPLSAADRRGDPRRARGGGPRPRRDLPGADSESRGPGRTERAWSVGQRRRFCRTTRKGVVRCGGDSTGGWRSARRSSRLRAGTRC